MAVVTGPEVADFLGQGDDAALVDLAWQHVEIVEQFVKAYTRGRGFSLVGEPAEDLAAVITTATARLVENPTLLRQEAVGPYTRSPGVLNGWTLPELAVLHRYRRRTA